MSGPRVVQVVCSDGFAGVERYVALLAKGLAARGCSVTVLGGAREQMLEAFHGGEVAWARADTPADAVRRLARLPKTDIVHAHMTEAEIAGVLSAPWHRSPVVTTRHFAARRGSGVASRLVGRGVASRLAAEMAISDFVADGVEGRPLTVHSGTPAVAGLAPSADRADAVLVAQRLEREKHTATAIEAWARSTLPRQGWRLWVAGSGSQEAALRGQAEALGVAESVDFLGRRPDMDHLYRRAAILCAPTPREGLGLAVVEAMAAGLPVVCADGGGHRETVGPTPGAALFPPGDASSAAGLLDALADDPAQRDRYGAALQQRQREYFSITRQVDETLEVYERVYGGACR